MEELIALRSADLDRPKVSIFQSAGVGLAICLVPAVRESLVDGVELDSRIAACRVGLLCVF